MMWQGFPWVGKAFQCVACFHQLACVDSWEPSGPGRSTENQKSLFFSTGKPNGLIPMVPPPGIVVPLGWMDVTISRGGARLRSYMSKLGFATLVILGDSYHKPRASLARA